MLGAEKVTRLPYKPRPHALAFHARGQKSAIVVWHRRAGKTVMCVADLVEKAMRCPLEMPQYGYIAPTYRQAKKIAWRYLKKIAEPVTKKIMESELSVELVNGAIITLFGADNPDSLRGLYFDGVVVDEYGDISPGIFGEILVPALADRDGWIVFIGTPKGPNHFFELWNAAANDDDWFKSMLPASKSGVLSAERLAKIKRQAGMDEDTYNQEFECDFNASNKGSYYGKILLQLEHQGHMGSFPWDPALPVITAWDIGFNDDTSVWFIQTNGREFKIIDFFSESGYSVDDVVAMLKEKPYTYGTFWLPHDAENKSFQTGKSVREQMLFDHGMDVEIVAKLSIQDGIQAVRKTLPLVFFNTDSDEVRSGLNALRSYQREFDDKLKKLKDKPKHDWASHPSDAFRYFALAMNPMAVEDASAKLRTEKPAAAPTNVINLENLFREREAQMKRPAGRI